jgi:hypothetical protein
MKINKEFLWAQMMPEARRFTLCIEAEKQQRHNLFQILFVIKNRRAQVIIDGGSCNNLVSADLGKNLDLTTHPHKHLYHIEWLNNSGKAKVTQTTRVHWSIF